MARCVHGTDMREACETCAHDGNDPRSVVLFPEFQSDDMIVQLAPRITFRLATEEEIAAGLSFKFWPCA